MFVRPRNPGPPLAPGTTILCRGCGRHMPLDGLHLKDKVRCKACGRIQWITEKHLEDEDFERLARRQRRGMWFGALTILFLCLLAVAPMASKSGERLLDAGTLSVLGISALWMALYLHVLCYGVGALVGGFLVATMLLVRRHTRELGIFGAVMTIFGGLGRMVLYGLGEQVGKSFTPSLPWGLVAWGAISTLGSVWRASLFPHR